MSKFLQVKGESSFHSSVQSNGRWVWHLFTWISTYNKNKSWVWTLKCCWKMTKCCIFRHYPYFQGVSYDEWETAVYSLVLLWSSFSHFQISLLHLFCFPSFKVWVCVSWTLPVLSYLNLCKFSGKPQLRTTTKGLYKKVYIHFKWKAENSANKL